MNAESFNFDVGVKNYKKNRLIVNHVHLKNEILFNIERTNKPNFVVSCVGYVNDRNNPRGFFNVIRDLQINSLHNCFNFYINPKGNVITNVEMSDVNYFYPDLNNTSNVVVCLSSPAVNKDNNSKAGNIYTYNQINTLGMLLETFAFDTKSTTFKQQEINQDLLKITNLGFDITNFVKQRGLV